ncbi:MAG TPA: MMPL family transporter [Solirubrobacterales bacterium]|nr:MMPL family transporter [Solirubrobacterales bacterium]
MRDVMTRLAKFLGRRRRWVVGAWVLIVVLALPFAAEQTSHLTGGGFDVPGSQSKAVSEALQEDFGERADGISVLLEAEDGASAAERAAAVDRVRREVAAVEEVTLAPADAARARVQLQRTGTALLPLRSDQSSDELIDSAGDLRSDLDPGTAESGVTPYLIGQPTIWAGMQEISKEDLSKAESSGFPIVAIILLVVFGSLAAAALPLALGFVSVLVTGALIYFLSMQMTMSVFVTNMASMIGIGVAIDYSLFILARYREEREAGLSKREARAKSLSTSGLAVTFSGLAVIISLAGLWMVDNQALRSMALGAMTVVAVSILTATTLLPALIAMLGDRVLPGGIVGRVERFFQRRFYRRHKPQPPLETPGASRFWVKWTERVMAHPWTAIIGVSAVLLLLASPLLSLQTGTEALQQFPKDSDVRVGTELASAELGGGTDPVQVVAEFGAAPTVVDRAAVAGFVRDLEGTAGVSSVAPPAYAADAVLVQATPNAGSESDAATALVERLRDTVVPASALSKVATVDVGGETARSHDVRVQITGSMWKIILFVLALSFVVLMVMLRSLLLPLKAVLMNLLSIGAAFGVLVAVFQWGWLDGFLGFESQGALDTINVPLIFAVVFGLSMDYEVFLMSRIRERFMRHGDNERAVAEGLSSSARTISSAALIMTAVFGVFVLTGVPSIKELGLGCAVAIALDATLVRLILVPAAMKLMGRWNWWMPAWLDRALPNLSFEGGEPEPSKA